MQLSAYLPIINVPVPEIAGEFSGKIAGIVTFDIPNFDMEFVFGGLTECPEEPEDDTFLTNLREESLSD